MRAVTRRWSVLVAATLSAVTAVLVAVSEGSSEVAEAAAKHVVADVYRECPGDRHKLSGKEGTSIYAPAGPSPIESIKNIPEFHDCQKLLLDSGRAYGPLVAIFASYDLSLERSLMVRDPFAEGQVALAGAVLHNFGEHYVPLNLPPGFSCLYLWRAGALMPTWHAKLVPAPNAEACGQPYLPRPGETGNLEVQRDPAPGFIQNSAYPAAARWDWDGISRQQYMGLQCGAAWCEIGNPGFRPSAAYLATTTSGSKAEQVQRIKGWYDEQSLAEPNGPGGAFVPGSARATVIPDTTLASRTLGDYKNRWKTVAYVALDQPSSYYEKKLNLFATRPGAPLSSLNTLSFCLGTRSKCKVPPANPGVPFSAKCGNWFAKFYKVRWWVRIDPAPARGMTPHPMYRCVDRMGHETESVTIPPTARWHWLNADETVWKECVTGCCQVRVLGGP